MTTPETRTPHRPRRRALLVALALLLAVIVAVLGWASSERFDAVVEVDEAAPDAAAADAAAPALETEATPAVAEPAAETVRELEPPGAERLAEYAARRPKTILELQLYRESTSVGFEHPAGEGEATLVDLNPRVNAWHVLQLALPTGAGDARRHAIYHLENPDPGVRVALEEGFPTGLVLRAAGGETARCDLWSPAAGSPAAGSPAAGSPAAGSPAAGSPAGSPDAGSPAAGTPDAASSLAAARASGATYAELCGGRLYLRNVTEGRRTRLEMATDLLRDSVWGGETITTFVRQNLYQDRYLQTSDVIAAAPGAGARPRPAGAPRRPAVDPAFEGRLLQTSGLGLELERSDGDAPPGQVLLGRWYGVRGVPGAFVSTLQARLVAPEVIASLKGRLNPLDEVESAALVYMVAFDLDAFELGFALGTDHPRVTWSERALPAVRDDALPGPDGIGSAAPLVRTGRLSPAAARSVTATFTGGFKRSHGAFKTTALATRNAGSHYGFVENGAVFSKLVPGLATAVVWDDGSVELKTWTEADDAQLGRVRHARQNGVPLIEHDAASGTSHPGPLVPRWADGNWSGSQDKRLRTLRAGLCLQAPAAGDGDDDSDGEDGRFLIYGYFTGATPSAMARVFTAYGCRYAMLLDMNALEHTYLAVYRRSNGRFLTQHLDEGMSVLDEAVGDQELPRFVAFADNRDFFYLLRRSKR